MRFALQQLLRLRNAINEVLQRFILGRVVLSLFQRAAKGRIIVISATRSDESGFWERTALGQSLVGLRQNPDIQLQIHYQNQKGLPAVYNQYVSRQHRDDILLFIHDDVWLDSDAWPECIRRGLGRFDVVGVAGNRRLTPTQPAWSFDRLDETGFHWDTSFLSGEVGHGKQKNGDRSRYGHYPARCMALDGVLLAARCQTLLAAGVCFDERFKFHFYDLDFCRNATSKYLTLGTWGVAITHQSGGAFGTTDWHLGYRKYLEKWG